MCAYIYINIYKSIVLFPKIKSKKLYFLIYNKNNMTTMRPWRHMATWLQTHIAPCGHVCLELSFWKSYCVFLFVCLLGRAIFSWPVDLIRGREKTFLFGRAPLGLGLRSRNKNNLLLVSRFLSRLRKNGINTAMSTDSNALSNGTRCVHDHVGCEAQLEHLFRSRDRETIHSPPPLLLWALAAFRHNKEGKNLFA